MQSNKIDEPYNQVEEESSQQSHFSEKEQIIVEKKSAVFNKHPQQINKQKKRYLNVSDQKIKHRKQQYLKMQVNLHQISYGSKRKLPPNSSKNPFNQKVKIRSVSQAIRLKKILEAREKQKAAQQEKTHQRLKQISFRRQELLEKLKHIDSQLTQTRNVQSPPLEKKIQQVKTNQSPKDQAKLIASKNYRQEAYNVSKHTQAVILLEKLTKEKMKKHSKKANDLKKKHEFQIKMINEIEKMKISELEQRRRRSILELAKKKEKQKQKLRKQEKINEQENFSFFPTTIKQQRKKIEGEAEENSNASENKEQDGQQRTQRDNNSEEEQDRGDQDFQHFSGQQEQQAGGECSKKEGKAGEKEKFNKEEYQYENKYDKSMDEEENQQKGYSEQYQFAEMENQSKSNLNPDENQ